MKSFVLAAAVAAVATVQPAIAETVPFDEVAGWKILADIKNTVCFAEVRYDEEATLSLGAGANNMGLFLFVPSLARKFEAGKLYPIVIVSSRGDREVVAAQAIDNGHLAMANLPAAIKKAFVSSDWFIFEAVDFVIGRFPLNGSAEAAFMAMECLRILRHEEP